jgi:hypothetical protein
MYLSVINDGSLTNSLIVDTIGAISPRFRFHPTSSISTPSEGDTYYDSEDDSLYLRVNSSWVALNRDGGGDLSASDTASMLTNYALSSEVASTYEPLLTNSAGLASALSDETGTGVAVFGTSPTFTTKITIGSEDITETVASYLNNVTSDVQTQLDEAASLNNANLTGNTTAEDLVAAKLSVGVAGGNMFEIDSVTKDGSSNYYVYDGADTLNPYIPYSARSTDDPWLIDDNHFYTFRAGSGVASDSVHFAKDLRGFGAFYVEEDSVYVPSFRLVGLSAGDSITWNAYYGNYITGVATDSLFTGPQATWVNQTTFTPNNVTTIPEDNTIWIELRADQFTGYRPYLWVLQMNFNYIRD